MKKMITIFGSSLPKEGEEEYTFAYEIARLLAEAGFNICSGGYQGIMDAVSKGAVEGGGEAHGVLVKGWGAVQSKHLTWHVYTESLFERIGYLVNKADGYLILPGGTGTLLELSVVWEFLNKRIMPEKPVVCVSDMWERIVDVMENRITLELRTNGLIRCTDKREEIVAYFKNKLIQT